MCVLIVCQEPAIVKIGKQSDKCQFYLFEFFFVKTKYVFWDLMYIWYLFAELNEYKSNP